MLIVLLIMLQLAQVDDFVEFSVCYLDTQAHPWEFRPHPEGQTLYVRKRQILTIINPSPHASGIDCVRICAAYGCKYIQGTVDSIIATLGDGK